MRTVDKKCMTVHTHKGNLIRRQYADGECRVGSSLENTRTSESKKNTIIRKSSRSIPDGTTISNRQYNPG